MARIGHCSSLPSSCKSQSVYHVHVSFAWRCRQERLLCLPATLSGRTRKTSRSKQPVFRIGRENHVKTAHHYGLTLQGSRKAHARFALR